MRKQWPTVRGLSDAQLAERAKGIGGSDAGRIMAGEWRQLWLEKTGRAQPVDLAWVIPVQIGNCTEQFNAEYFEHVTGRAVTRRGEVAVSKKYPWMRANLDGVTTVGAECAYWDAKHVGRSDEKMVLRYTPQMTHCCVILNLDYWVLSVLVGNSKHEIIEQQCDPFYVIDLIEQEREFWRYVERDEEPRDRNQPIEAPKPKPKRHDIDLNGGTWSADGRELIPDPAWPNWAAEWIEHAGAFERTHDAHAAHMIARDAMKKLVPEDAGTIERGNVVLKQDGRGITIALKKE